MISATYSKEARKRDTKRKRILLKIGDKRWHITREEGKALRDQLTNLLGDRNYRRFSPKSGGILAIYESYL